MVAAVLFCLNNKYVETGTDISRKNNDVTTQGNTEGVGELNNFRK